MRGGGLLACWSLENLLRVLPETNLSQQIATTICTG